MKSRLFPPCVVAAPCRTGSATAGLRLAWRKNPSISFRNVFGETDYWCSVRHCVEHKTASLAAWRRCNSSQCKRASLRFAPGQAPKSIGFLKFHTASITAVESQRCDAVAVAAVADDELRLRPQWPQGASARLNTCRQDGMTLIAAAHLAPPVQLDARAPHNGSTSAQPEAQPVAR